MAGDWIKMESATPDKPEVLALTVKMGWDDPDLTVGKLFKLWRWFDQHTTEGNAAGVTPALLDRYFGVTGFVTALTQVGWLNVTNDGISLPNFDRHNGASAKQRSLTAKRVANHKSNAKANAEGNAPIVNSPLPREEKRREEKSNSKEPKGSYIRASKKCPDSFVVTDELSEWAKTDCPLINVASETAAFKDYTFSSAKTDWIGTWRNWMRKANTFASEKQKPKTGAPKVYHALNEMNYAEGVKEDGSF